MYEIPIFPLNTVLFPGMPLTLHIFEERYQLMLQKVMLTNQTFGVNLIHSGAEASGPLPDPFKIGCTARIIKVEPVGDGRVNLTVIGDERYRIIQTSTAQPYLTGFVESLPLEKPASMEVSRGARQLRPRVVDYLSLLAKHSTTTEGEQQEIDLDFDLTEMQLPEDPLMLVYLSAALLQVPAAEKQPLLEAEDASQLLKMI